MNTKPIFFAAALLVSAAAQAAEPPDPCTALGRLAVAVAEAHNAGADQALARAVLDGSIGLDTPADIRALLVTIVTSAYDPDNEALIGSPALYGSVVEHACRQAAR